MSDASGSKDFALARYGPNGTLDPHFGQRRPGHETSRSLTADIIHGIAVQPDGKIVVAGVTYEDVVTVGPNGDFMVARYLPDGRTDLAFGIGGVMTTDFGDSSYDEPYALVLQPDGKIVLGGYTNAGNGPGVLFGADQLALARYGPNGLLDPSFGRGRQGGLRRRQPRRADPGPGPAPGTAACWPAATSTARSAATSSWPACGPTGSWPTGCGKHRQGPLDQRPRDQLRAASPASSSSPTARSWPGVRRRWPTTPTSPSSATSPTGSFDPTFGRGGVASFDFEGREDRIHAVALQPDGKIVAVGQSEADFALARFNG